MSDTNIETIPENLRSVLTITEIDDARLIAGPLFRQKYAQMPPEVPSHLAAFYRAENGRLLLAGYSHMRRFDEVCLSGGSCTDGDTIRAMTQAHRNAVDAAGGILRMILGYAFAKYGDACDAFFGHCGNARALEVTRAAGFVPTDVEHVIARFHKPLQEDVKRALIAKVVALGPF